jgi:hypothetical protein
MNRRASRQLIDSAEKAVEQELGRIDFARRRAGILTIPVNEDVIGWVGLNRGVAYGDGMLRINPMTGVRHQPLERFIAELHGERFHAYLPATTGMQLGYLMPEQRYVQWVFGEDTDHHETARTLAEAMRAYGIPFMQANGTLGAVYETMRQPGTSKDDYSIIAALVMLGRPEEAKAVIQKELKEQAQFCADTGIRRDDIPACEQFDRFVANLRRHEGWK